MVYRRHIGLVIAGCGVLLFSNFIFTHSAAAAGPVLNAGDTFNYLDADGDRVVITAEGTAGTATLAEHTTDGIGNEDGVLADGEELGEVIITGAATDFRLRFAQDITAGVGNRVIKLGKIVADEQTILGMVADTPETRFELIRYTGVGFSAFGGITVSAIVGDTDKVGVVLRTLADTTSITTTDAVDGAVVIRDNLDGKIDVGTAMSGDLTVGGKVNNTSILRTGGSQAGTVTVLGNYEGDVTIGARAYGVWKVVGTVTADAVFTAGNDFNQFYVTESFFGSMTAVERVWLKVGGSVGGTAKVAAKQTTVLVGATFFGEVNATTKLYVWVADSVAPPAQLTSLAQFTLVIGRRLYPGVIITAPNPAIYYVPNLSTTGTLITQLPYVITTPGNYKLGNHLTYTPSNGSAIEIQADDVTLDLKGFTLRGSAGSSTQAMGIHASNRSNITIRNGTISGFLYGVRADSNTQQVAQNYLLEDLRVTDNWYFGLWVASANALLRNNAILRTGGTSFSTSFTRPTPVRISGSNARLENSVISGLVRSPFTEEFMGVHVTAAPDSTVTKNIFANTSDIEDTWGSWVNGGVWGQAGETNVTFSKNIFSRWQFAAAYSFAQGTHTQNTLLNVPDYFTNGTEGGGNIIAK